MKQHFLFSSLRSTFTAPTPETHQRTNAPTHRRQRFAKSYLLFLMTVLFYYNSIAQTNLFSFISQPNNMTDTELKIKTTVSDIPRAAAFRFIKFSDGIVDANGVLKMTLPNYNNNLPVTFTVRNVHFDDPTHYAVYATCRNGSATLFYTPEGRSAEIQVANRAFEVYPLENGKGIIFEPQTITDDTKGICGNDWETALTPNVETDFCQGDCGTAVLDVLILITPEAKAWLNSRFGNMYANFLYRYGAQMNLAFQNSLISYNPTSIFETKSVRVSWTEYTPDFQWSTDFNGQDRLYNDRDKLTNSSLARSLMNLHNADVAVALTNNNYTSSNYVGYGIANSTDPLEENKMCIVQVGTLSPTSALPTYTFSHEVAHQFGCQHSAVQNVPNCPKGKTFTINGGTTPKGTIMSNEVYNNERILYYSNPNVYYSPNPFETFSTGEPGQRDNAQQIRAAFCEVANNNELSIFAVDYTLSSGRPCSTQTVTFQPTVTVGQQVMLITNTPYFYGVAPYTYAWKISATYDFNFGEIISTEPIGTFTIPSYYGSYFFLQLTVTSADGYTATATKKISCRAFDGRFEEEYSPVISGKIVALPNPADDYLQLAIPELSNIKTVSCFNTLGTYIPLSYEIADLPNTVAIRTESLPQGMYIFRVDYADGRHIATKVIISPSN